MSRTIRFSIAGLMGAVLIVAIGLAALRSASEIWAGVIFLSTCGVLALAIVGIFCRREAERAWWLGFALFGWGYMALASGRGTKPDCRGCRPWPCSSGSVARLAYIPRLSAAASAWEDREADSARWGAACGACLSQ